MNTKTRNLFLFILFSLIMVHCETPTQKIYKTGLGLRVQIPTGALDPLDSETHFEYLNLPYIGNKAIIPNLEDDDIEFLILSEAFDKNEFLQTYAIAVLRIEVHGELKNIVICMPSDTEKEVFRINNFMEFVSEYYFLKQNVENWYLNRHGLGNTKLVSWENESFALNLINRKLKNQG